VLAFGIKSAGCLIEQDYLGFADEGTSDGNSLLLTARETDAAFAHLSVESLREKELVFDESQCVGLSASLYQLLLFLCLCRIAEVNSVAYVLSDTAREKNWLLLDKGQLLLMVPRVVQVLDLLSAEEQLAFNWIIEALNKRDDGAFTTTRVTNQGHNLILAHLDVDTLEDGHITLGWVRELYILKLDAAICGDVGRCLGLQFAVIVDLVWGHNKYCDFVTRAEDFSNGLDVVGQSARIVHNSTHVQQDSCHLADGKAKVVKGLTNNVDNE